MLDTVSMVSWVGFWRYRQLYHRYTVEGLEKLDGRRSSLIVGYHARGFASDLCMLSVALYRRLGYLPHLIVHRGVHSLPFLGTYARALGFVSGDGRSIVEAISRGEHLVTAPGGAWEACRSFRQGGTVRWGNRMGYVRLALKHRLPIVPVAAGGTDWTLVGLNDGPALGERLGLPRDWGWVTWLALGPFGPWPLSPPFPVRINQLIGDPIDPQADGPVDPRDGAAVEEIHHRVMAEVQGLLDRANGVERPCAPQPKGRSGMKFSDYDTAIAILKKHYQPGELSKDLTMFLLGMYDKPAAYLKAIGEVFYQQLPDEFERERHKLSALDRERCIIAMLTSRRGGFSLAVHIYLALMEGMENDEIANIMFLAGVYTGADNFTDGLFTHARTLTLLKDIAEGHGAKDAPAILNALRNEFAGF